MKSEQMLGAGFPASGIKHLGDRKLVILMTVRKSSPATAQEIINTQTVLQAILLDELPLIDSSV